MARVRTAVLISGRGSNLQALLDAAADASFPAEIVCVISNRPGAGGLARAEAAGVAALTLDHKAYNAREAFEDALHAALTDQGAELVCLAGFMRLLTPGFVQRWQGRMINIHPSLLPSFKGVDTHQRALDAGVKLTGASVHFVSAEMDAGPVIGQGAVPVLPGDDAAALAARVLTVEHKLYPECLRQVASGQARLVDGRVVIARGAPASAMLLNPPPI
ncbi:phosphoribosylglycinamide formyltransferase [Alkalicaulis satelles]|uniref:Phosphoribosylglycinamide formyltransferase n=1 Tax=Alkalicaulis satelles TaxID=2609175 RepID=A0A5M6ZIB4_9PROT|nr:phosphoribosylglycinamide formyltransferase [Alkalicaulis satelles]KAA5804576.1 phosphoribosylglycinamide formyltransferase [Alkalicaulis satelles]